MHASEFDFKVRDGSDPPVTPLYLNKNAQEAQNPYIFLKLGKIKAKDPEIKRSVEAKLNPTMEGIILKEIEVRSGCKNCWYP